MNTPLSYDCLEAVPVVLPPHQHVHFWIVGCGGTGSFLVQLIIRIARSLVGSGKSSTLTLVDPDQIELKNVITRQCFCEAEIGLNKAKALAARYSLAWTCDQLTIEAIPEKFDPRWLKHPLNTLTVLLGCVDNAAARRILHTALADNRYYTAQHLWYLDAGNGDRWGQVLVGSSHSTQPKDYEFSELGCLRLPAPGIQTPELLLDKPEEQETPQLSCEELALLNQQSLTVNAQSATLAADLALELVTGKLTQFAVHFDLKTRTTRARYITQSAIAAILPGSTAPTQAA